MRFVDPLKYFLFYIKDNIYLERSIVWQIIILTTVAFNTFLIPLFIVFPHLSKFNILFWGISSIFLLDLLHNLWLFNVQGKEQGIKVNHFYIKHHLIKDILLSLPYLSIFDLLGFKHRGYVIFTLLYLFRHKELIKSTCIDLSKIHFSSITYWIHISIVRLIRIFVVVFFIAHYIACIWLFIKLGILNVERVMTISDIGYLYLNSVYWSITTITTVGYGDLIPISLLEKCYAMMVMLLGVGIYGYIIGNVTQIIKSFNLSDLDRHENLYLIKQFIYRNNISSKTEKKILQYYFHNMKFNIIAEQKIIEMLPCTLQKDVLLELHQDLILKVPFFEGLDVHIISSIILELKFHIFLPDDYIIYQNDVAKSIFFLQEGIVKVFDEYDKEQKVSLLSPGAYFGEISLLDSNMYRTKSIKASTYCCVYELSKDRFQAIITQYPKLGEAVRMEARRRKKIFSKIGKDQNFRENG